MNPKEFGWSDDQQVTVINPTKDDFSFKVHSKDYQVPAGMTAKMPGYIAWVYVYNLSSKLCQEAGEFGRWNEEGFRKKYYDKLAIGTDDIIQTVDTQSFIDSTANASNVTGQSSEEEAFPTVNKEVKDGRSKKS